MANLQAISGSTTISLMDGAPFKLLSARGMSGPAIRRVTARGPAQHGDTDLGYRLQPREIELEIGFAASTDAILDGYRDDLMEVFKPLTSTPVNLRYTRDDGEVRQIDVYTVGSIKIDFLPEFRPGHYHRATVRLLAPDPTYYDPVPGTATVQGTAVLDQNWYRAGGAISSGRVLMQGGSPAIGEAWSYAGTVSNTYTLVFRTAPESDAGGVAVAWRKDAFSLFSFQKISAAYYVQTGDGLHYLGDFVTAGTANYYVHVGQGGMAGGGGDLINLEIRRGTAAVIRFDVLNQSLMDGTVRVWRNNYEEPFNTWSPAIHRYALYSPGLSYGELVTLEPYITGDAGGTISPQVGVQLEGDMPEFPIITLTGPITGASIYHTYSGERISFGSAVAIGAGTTVVIDTRPGYKTVLANGSVNLRGSLTPESDLGTWHLSPDFTQGANQIILSGNSTGTATRLDVVYYHRYSSF